jgi:glycosyltransferase involved in cell wall biosynthesis
VVTSTVICFDPVTLLCVGRLAPQKGFDLAVSALGLLHKRYPNMRLVIAGDGPARADLEFQAKKLGIAPHVEFLGWVEPGAVADLMNKATIVIVPSRGTEAFGLVALEASLMSRPVIVANSGGLAEIIVANETGLTFQKDDTAGLAQAIASLLDDHERATRMAQAARVRANALFSLQRYVDDSDALYRAVLAQWTANNATFNNASR